LKDGHLGCVIRSPGGTFYKTASLREFCKDFNLVYHNLTNSWFFKRPCARGIEKGWQIVSRFKKTKEVKKHFQDLDQVWYICDDVPDLLVML
jgi:hypothetical protein